MSLLHSIMRVKWTRWFGQRHASPRLCGRVDVICRIFPRPGPFISHHLINWSCVRIGPGIRAYEYVTSIDETSYNNGTTYGIAKYFSFIFFLFFCFFFSINSSAKSRYSRENDDRKIKREERQFRFSLLYLVLFR